MFPWRWTEIAEANPHKFRLDYGELESRKQFIRDTRGVVKVNKHLSVCRLYPPPPAPKVYNSSQRARVPRLCQLLRCVSTTCTLRQIVFTVWFVMWQPLKALLSPTCSLILFQKIKDHMGSDGVKSKLESLKRKVSVSCVASCFWKLSDAKNSNFAV